MEKYFEKFNKKEVRKALMQVSEKHLKYIGSDSWNRPVYEDETGKRWKDVDPRTGRMPELCSVTNNDFEGEPDTPMDYMECYQGIKVIFEPERSNW